MIDVQSLKKALPRAPEQWLVAAIEETPKWNIDTINELATFLAQCAHESSEFLHLVENLYYSTPERLMVIWPTRFKSKEQALPYTRNPEKLANLVYANRMGNGPPESGDGWRHRGAGPIQITGKDNQTACASDLGIPLQNFVKRVQEPYDGIRSACWYWKVYRLDEVDDDEDQKQDTRRIQGGQGGLEERQRLFRIIKAQLEDQ